MPLDFMQAFLQAMLKKKTVLHVQNKIIFLQI